MEKNTPVERHYQNDEIDLYDLWLILKKRKVIILLIALVSLGIAIAYVVLAPKVYRITNTIVINNILEKGERSFLQEEEIVAILNDLNMILMFEGEKAATRLNMRRSDLNKIKKVKVSEIKNTSVVNVDIETFDSKAGIALMKALPEYILRVPNIANKLDMQKALMEKNREDLKTIIDNPTRELKLPSNTIVYVPSIDLYKLNQERNQLTLMIGEIEKGRIVSLVWKNEPPERHYKPKMLMSILLGIVIGSFVGTFVAILMEWSSNARRVRGID